MSEVNILEIPIVPEYPGVLASQSVAVLVPVGTSTHQGIVKGDGQYTLTIGGVIHLTAEVEGYIGMVSGMASELSVLSNTVYSQGLSISNIYESVSIIQNTLSSAVYDISALELSMSNAYSSLNRLSLTKANISDTAYSISLHLDNSNYKLYATLLDLGGYHALGMSVIDLPLETMVIGASVSSSTLYLTLQNGTVTSVPLGDMLAGLQTEITEFNKLDADLVDDTSTVHKFVNQGMLIDISSNTSARHTHSNKSLLDTYTVSNVDLISAVTDMHSHSNKALLDTYAQTEPDLSSAVALRHSHSNKTVLDNITQQDLDNLSALSSIIDGGGIGGVSDYAKLHNQPILVHSEIDNVSVVSAVLPPIDNWLVKTNATKSVVIEPLSSVDTSAKLNIMAQLNSSNYSQYITSSTYNAWEMINEMADNGFDFSNLDLTDISYTYSSNNFEAANLMELWTGDTWEYLIAYSTSSMFGLALTEYSSRYSQGFVSEMSSTSNIISENMWYAKAGNLYSWYSGAFLNYSDDFGAFFNLQMNLRGGQITEIYQPSFVNKNFGKDVKYFPEGNVYQCEDGNWYPIVNEHDLSSYIKVTTELPVTPNYGSTPILVYSYTTPSTFYEGYIYYIRG